MTLELFDVFMDKVLKKLRESKENKSWNVAELAENSGLATQSIYSLAAGQRGKEPEFSTIFKLAQALGWTMEDIAAELFPDQAGTVYRLVREKPKFFDNLIKILDKGDSGDINKLLSDIDYMAGKID